MCVQRLAAHQKIDFIKLDIEGAEKLIFEDSKSREVLCNATCLFVELHDRYEDGCTTAFERMLSSGCQPSASVQFRSAFASGEYQVVCKEIA